ncbi:hypothetical protein ON010_g5444 [Phytophthora cinnamomi]|nr:hypothetical protein ON010_g5444 [Phytophthora cinnamomi]
MRQTRAGWLKSSITAPFMCASWACALNLFEWWGRLGLAMGPDYNTCVTQTAVSRSSRREQESLPSDGAAAGHRRPGRARRGAELHGRLHGVRSAGQRPSARRFVRGGRHEPGWRPGRAADGDALALVGGSPATNPARWMTHVHVAIARREGQRPPPRRMPRIDMPSGVRRRRRDQGQGEETGQGEPEPGSQRAQERAGVPAHQGQANGDRVGRAAPTPPRRQHRIDGAANSTTAGQTAGCSGAGPVELGLQRRHAAALLAGYGDATEAAAGEIKLARSMESLLQKRARQQVSECAGYLCPNGAQGRTLEFLADKSTFDALLASIDAAYLEVDEVFAATGLADSETPSRDARMREGANGMYLDINSNKLLPFSMEAVGTAVWNHFKGADKHRGAFYEKAAKALESSDDTVMEDFKMEFMGKTTRANFRVKQVLRRYVEADREVVVSLSSVHSLDDSKSRLFAGLGFAEKSYVVIKRPKSLALQKGGFTVLQMCSLVVPQKADSCEQDATAVGAFTEFVLNVIVANTTKQDTHVVRRGALKCSNALGLQLNSADVPFEAWT